MTDNYLISNTSRFNKMQEAANAALYDQTARSLLADDTRLLLKENDWLKFDRPCPPSNAYVYAVQSLDDVQNKHVLEVGCGDGYLSVILAKRGALVSGFDISPASIEVCQKRAHLHGVADRIEFRTLSCYQTDYPSEHFDLAIGLDVLHHMDILPAIKEVYRILRTGGKTVFMEPLRASQLLKRLRPYIPVGRHRASHGVKEHPLDYHDLNRIQGVFPNVRWKEFQLFMRLDHVLSGHWWRRPVALLDQFLLTHLNPLRPWARQVVIEAKK